MQDPANEALSALTSPGMGTENAGPVLRALARMLRPRTTVEVGAGSSTLHLLLGLRDARAEAVADRDPARGEAAHPERVSALHPYAAPGASAPRLLVVDDISVPGTSAHRVDDAAGSLGLADMLTFIERDFFDLSNQELAAWGPLDLVWLDAGTQADDCGFLAALWPRVAPGGMVVLHEPYLATTARTRSGRSACRVVPTPLLQELRRQNAVPDGDFDVLALSEPHKHRQTGLLLLRKRAGWERDRKVPFGEELMALGETPPREVVQLGAAPASAPGTDTQGAERMSAERLGVGRMGVERMGAALADDGRLAVYSAVVLGAGTVGEVEERLGTPDIRCADALAVLEEAGLVTYEDGRWSVADGAWRDVAPVGDRS
ncbi:class I SAM-dependent methyltransferase [Streptomyces sp. N35]|uniref:class I SAM-dependent methyltransferase n=1 Tax=Streptomyces sp. N35 TaxID=2795730 RepID=UPI0018F480DB|nr:class I SAM-dependent methyltransferase [Streptomyces sp. N35]